MPNLKPARGAQLNVSDPFARKIKMFLLLNESTGNKAFDSSLNGNIGTINGAIWESGSLDFNGSSDYITIPSSDCFHFKGGDFAVAVRFKPTVSLGTTERLLDYAVNPDGTGNSVIVVQWNSTNSNVRCFLRNSINENLLGNISVNNVVSAGNWYTLIYTRIGNVFILYLNKEPIGTVTQSGNQKNGASPFNLGRNPSGAGSLHFEGLIDYFTVWKGRGLMDASRFSSNPYTMFERPSSARFFFIPAIAPLLRLNLSSNLAKTLAHNSKVTRVKKHASKLAKTLLFNSTRN